eukprot:CAMPEP_0197875486 /NCGR_PEP_ID=MMETSP1439-20131203/4727_1 /TAXON_ID=66791 /ORGANISM="Gonyaulax spinifera, Strain CCMP409" /LENGTH=67 /DNA_ID=CAMNT_0043494691 /DNA_START=99 /DNA_END=299 /DNA_ORIENTATION=+
MALFFLAPGAQLRIDQETFGPAAITDGLHSAANTWKLFWKSRARLAATSSKCPALCPFAAQASLGCR